MNELRTVLSRFLITAVVLFAPQLAAEVTLIRAVNVLPMTTPGLVLANQSVLVEDGVISRIAPQRQLVPPQDARVIDGKQAYLLPGLTEMHAHIPVASRDGEQYLYDTLFLYLSQGVTTVRGMLGDPSHLELRDRIASGQLLAPRLYTSSPSLNGRTVSSAAEAQAKVREYHAAGYDFLKIHPGIGLSAMDTLVTTAKELGMEVSGHVPAAVGLRRALSYGYGTIDHLDGYVTGIASEAVNADQGGFFGFAFAGMASDAKLAELVAMTRDSGTAIVPTQTLFTRWASPIPAGDLAAEPEMQFMPKSVVGRWQARKEELLATDGYSAQKHRQFIELRNRLLRELKQAGVPILLGSDAPQVFNVPGFSIFHEMEAMIAAGFSEPFVLLSGTREPARYFGAKGQFGTITEGAVADLVLVVDNPLEDIRRMRQQRGIMRGGHWLSRQDITERLQKIANRRR